MTFKPGDVGHLAEHDRISGELAGRLSDTSLSATIDDASRARNMPKQRAVAAAASSVVTVFQAGHGWTKLSGSGTVSDDVSVFARGSQSLKVSTVGGGFADPTIVGKTGLPSVDMTKYDLQITFAIDDWYNVPAAPHAGFRIRFGGDLTVNYAERSIGPLQTMDTRPTGDRYELLGRTGKWQTYSVTAAIVSGFGAINMADITAFGVYLADNGAPVTVHLQGVALVPKPRALYPRGVVSFTLDDGYDNAYTTAAPILDGYGFPATAFIIADAVGVAGYVTHSQLVELQNAHGWEIASHAMQAAFHTQPGGFSVLTAQQLDTDFSNQKDWMRSHGYLGADYSAYPQGMYNDTVVNTARNYFTSVRTTQNYDGLESIPPGDPMRVRCIGLADGLTLASVKTYVDQAYNTGAWVVFYLHQVTASPTGISCTPAFFQQVVDYVAAKGVPVRTYGDVISGKMIEQGQQKSTLGLIPPSDYGFKGWNMDPMVADTGLPHPSAGSLWGARVYCNPGDVVGSVLFQVANAGVACTGGYVAIYDSAGNQLAVSGETAAQFNTTGAKKVPFTRIVVPADGILIPAILINAATTLPKLGGHGGGSATSFSFPGVGRNARAWSSGSGLSVAPSTVNLATVTQVQQVPFYAVGA